MTQQRGAPVKHPNEDPIAHPPSPSPPPSPLATHHLSHSKPAPGSPIYLGVLADAFLCGLGLESGLERTVRTIYGTVSPSIIAQVLEIVLEGAVATDSIEILTDLIEAELRDLKWSLLA